MAPDRNWQPPGGVPANMPVTGQAAGIVIRRVIERMGELDTADLTVAGGDTVAILCTAELEQWLYGLAIRAEAGERL